MRYFDENEFVCQGVNVFHKMNNYFLLKLDECRHDAGIPFKINSSYRTPEYNKSIGGARNSQHIKGLAVDVKCGDGESRLKIVKAAIDNGLTVGVYSTFIHIDGRNEQLVFHGKY